MPQPGDDVDATHFPRRPGGGDHAQLQANTDMAAVPFTYIARNLWLRRVTTLLTAAGTALVVYVFATVLMRTESIRAALVAAWRAARVKIVNCLRAA